MFKSQKKKNPNKTLDLSDKVWHLETCGMSKRP